MCLLGLTITVALVPLKSSIEDISSRLCTIEEIQNWAPGDDLLDDGDDFGYCALSRKFEDGGEEHVDYHVASAPSRADDEDMEMDDAHTVFAKQDQDTHPYFESIILHAREDTHDQYEHGQLQSLTTQAKDEWEDFCHHHSIAPSVLPPANVVNETFLKIIRI